MLKKALLGAAALVATVAIAIAGGGGMWNGYPQVNSPSYCSSFVNGNCVNTVPAGPAATGNEQIPGDTEAAGGQNPQTVTIPAPLMGVGLTDYEVPLTGATITETQQMRQLIIDPAGTLAALTVVLPAATTLIDQQEWAMCTTQIITALTLTAGSGSSVKNAPTALLVPVATGAASCVKYHYVAAKTAWYRLQ